ncbi:MAG: ATP-binding protein [Ignavibacteriales bacterium]|nr:ATP-binding protein [Ignavibacteriales bacterium]
MLIDNPFKFGDPVEGEYYLPRPELARTVGQFLDNRIHVILIGPRRFGKTSFILNLLKEKTQSSLFIDVFNITSHRDFLQQVLRAIRGKKPWSAHLKEWLSTIPRLRPRFEMQPDPVSGTPTLSLSAEVSSDKDVKETIQDVLAALEHLGKQVIVTIDEFQKIAEIEDKGWLEATLRTQMQQLKNVAFLYTGSRKGIIYDMINNSNRPFYRSCQPIEFPAFGTEFTDWIIQRFSIVNITCERAAVDHLRRILQDTPNYIQMVCFHVVAQGIQNVTQKKMDDVLNTIVRQNAYAYQTLLNSLAVGQQRALRLAANELTQIFAKDLLAKYEIKTGPALHAAIKSLKDKQILDEGTAKGKVFFDDPLFAIWLRTEFGE